MIILAFGSYLLPEKRLLKPISAVQEQAYGQAEKELFSLSIEELSQSIDEGRINEKSNIIRNTKMTFPSESDQLEIILQNSNQAIWIEKKEADDGIIEANYISYFKFKDYDMTRIALPPTFSKNENQMTIEVPHKPFSSLLLIRILRYPNLHQDPLHIRPVISHLLQVFRKFICGFLRTSK